VTVEEGAKGTRTPPVVPLHAFLVETGAPEALVVRTTIHGLGALEPAAVVRVASEPAVVVRRTLHGPGAPELVTKRVKCSAT
jgi:hypothetical protein